MVADTYSTDGVGVLLMGTGNDNNSWGDNANTSVFQIIMDALANVLTSAVTGGTLTLSGSPPPAAASQTRYAALKFTGILASNQVVQVPNLNKWWLVCNATSGAFTLKFKTASGSASTAIPQNSGWQMVRCTGADVIEVWPFNTAQIQMPDGTVGAPAYSNLTEPTSGWWRAGTQDWRLTINGVDVLQCTGTGASSASIINVLSPNALQVAGVAVFVSGSTIRAASGTVGAPGFSFSAETASGLYRIGSNNVGMSINGVKVTEWNATTYIVNLAATITGILTLSSTTSMAMAKGTTAQRAGSPAAGDVRYNTSFSGLEYYNGTAWIILGQPITVRTLSGSGNYTPTTGVVRIRVRMCGPGGGGGAGGSGSTGGDGSADTSFGSWTAKKGLGGPGGNASGAGGDGGFSGTDGTGTLIQRRPGGNGQGGADSTVTTAGGVGGENGLGGAGTGVRASTGTSAETATGAGGGGGGQNNGKSGNGGGAGEIVEFWVNNPGVIAYVVGTGGGAGTGGSAQGGNGADGTITIEEFYC